MRASAILLAAIVVLSGQYHEAARAAIEREYTRIHNPAERTQIEAARRDVNACIEYCTGMRQAPVHRRLQNIWDTNDRTISLFPIEHGKTTQTEWRIIWSMGKYPDRARAYVSSGERPCRKVIRNIKRTIETNERLHKVFPNLKPEMEADGAGRTCWGSLELRVAGAPTGRRDASIAGYGWEGQITGSRLDEIYIDNVCNKKNTYTPNMRASVLEAIENDILSRLLPGGVCHVTDTSWYDDDPPHVMGAREAWHFSIEDAEAGDIPGETLWPEQWPWERLYAKRDEIGQMAYDRTLRNITTSQSRGTFKRDFIEPHVGVTRWYDSIEWPRDREESIKVVTGVDLATRKGEEHDLTVLFTAQLVDTKYRLLNIRAARLEGVEILKAILEVHRDFHTGVESSLIRVEDNAAQKYIVDMTRDAEIMRSLGATNRELAFLNVEGHTTTVKKRDLEFGVPSVASDLQMGRWQLPKHPETAKLIEEMLRWSPDDHTGDRLMAMWICREGLRPSDPDIRVV